MNSNIRSIRHMNRILWSRWYLTRVTISINKRFLQFLARNIRKIYFHSQSTRWETRTWNCLFDNVGKSGPWNIHINLTSISHSGWIYFESYYVICPHSHNDRIASTLFFWTDVRISSIGFETFTFIFKYLIQLFFLLLLHSFQSHLKCHFLPMFKPFQRVRKICAKSHASELKCEHFFVCVCLCVCVIVLIKN